MSPASVVQKSMRMMALLGYTGPDEMLARSRQEEAERQAAAARAAALEEEKAKRAKAQTTPEAKQEPEELIATLERRFPFMDELRPVSMHDLALLGREVAAQLRNGANDRGRSGDE